MKWCMICWKYHPRSDRMKKWSIIQLVSSVYRNSVDRNKNIWSPSLLAFMFILFILFILIILLCFIVISVTFWSIRNIVLLETVVLFFDDFFNHRTRMRSVFWSNRISINRRNSFEVNRALTSMCVDHFETTLRQLWERLCSFKMKAQSLTYRSYLWVLLERRETSMFQ